MSRRFRVAAGEPLDSFHAMTSETSNPAIAFVAGASGYTGREVVRALVARGVHTVAHLRPGGPQQEARRADLSALGATVDETPWEPDALAATLGTIRPTHCFALLGTTRRRAAAEAIDNPYETIDYGLSRLLLDAVRAAGLTPRFVYLSAVGASEQARNPYLAVRGRFECELRAAALPYVIARPAFISGPDRRESRPAERAGAVIGDLALGIAAMVGRGDLLERYGSMSARLLATALVELGLDPAATQVEADGARLRAAARRAESRA